MWWRTRIILTGLCAVGSLAIPAGVSAGEAWTLDRALAHVGENAPDARVAQLRFEKARAQLDEARAQWLPKLTAETGYSATDNPTQAFMFLLNQRQLTFGGDFNDPDVTDNWGSEIRLEYPLYTGGAREAGQKAADAGVAASEFELAAVRRQLELEIAKAYFTVLRARAVVDAAKASLESQQSNLDLATELVEGGKALQTAVLDLETRVAGAEADLAAAENQRELAIAMLQTLLGLDDDEVGGFTVAEAWTTIEYPGEVIGTSERAELRALDERAEQAEAGIEIAKSGKRPTVAAFASTRHDEGFTEPDGGNSWLAGVMVRLRLFDGGEVNAQVAQAEADRAIIDEQYRKQRQQIELQVKTARLNLETARKRIDLAEKAITSAEKSLELTRTRFQEGIALSTQLIDAETALTGARVRHSGARAEERIALATYRHALGLPIRELNQSSK
ncbi:MAG: TolC family protein [Verrucomicrobiae bacterium]|nr:TolC family protein [Verrucomicrobiae bacterium]